MFRDTCGKGHHPIESLTPLRLACGQPPPLPGEDDERGRRLNRHPGLDPASRFLREESGMPGQARHDEGGMAMDDQ